MTGQAGHRLLLVYPPPPPGAIIARETLCQRERQCPESAYINIIPSGLCNSRQHRKCPASASSVQHTPGARRTVLQGVRLHNPDYVKYAPSVSCESPTSELPGEAAAGKEFAQGGDHPSPPSLTPHFPGASIHRHQFSRPAPAVVLAPQALRTTASATCIYEASVVCEAGKCRPEDRQCYATGISRLQRWWYAIILPPYAASAAGSFQAVTPLPPQAPSEESRPSTPR